MEKTSRTTLTLNRDTSQTESIDTLIIKHRFDGELHLDGQRLRTYARFNLLKVDLRALFGNKGSRQEKAVSKVRDALSKEYGSTIANVVLDNGIKAVRGDGLQGLKDKAESMKAESMKEALAVFTAALTDEFGHEISGSLLEGKTYTTTKENYEIWDKAALLRKQNFEEALKTEFGEKISGPLLEGKTYTTTKEQCEIRGQAVLLRRKNFEETLRTEFGHEISGPLLGTMPHDTKEQQNAVRSEARRIFGGVITMKYGGRIGEDLVETMPIRTENDRIHIQKTAKLIVQIEMQKIALYLAGRNDFSDKLIISIASVGPCSGTKAVTNKHINAGELCKDRLVWILTQKYGADLTAKIIKDKMDDQYIIKHYKTIEQALNWEYLKKNNLLEQVKTTNGSLPSNRDFHRLLNLVDDEEFRRVTTMDQ